MEKGEAVLCLFFFPIHGCTLLLRLHIQYPQIAIHIIMIIFDIFFFGQQMPNLKLIWFCDRL